MKISARNQLKGKVKQITPGAVNAEVIVELPGGQEIVAIVTLPSVKNLALSKGDNVVAIVKASSVILGVD